MPTRTARVRPRPGPRPGTLRGGSGAWLAVAALLVAACRYAPAGQCSQASECLRGQRCVEGLCVGCSAASDCQWWETCTSERACKALAGSCGSAVDCHPWETCGGDHACSLTPGMCSGDGDCAAKQMCSTEWYCVAKPYTIHPYVGPTIWTFVSKSAAVDALDRLYVTDGMNVFRVDGGTPSVYLSEAELVAAIGPSFSSYWGIIDLDVAADGNLYLLVDYPYEGVYVSTAAHQVALKFDLSPVPGFLFEMNMVSPDRALYVVGYDGVYEATAAGTRRVYGNSFLGISDCATPDFAAMRDGYFFYAAGCNGSPLLGGPSDGTGVGLLHVTDDMGLGYWPNFEGFGRDPQGGIVLNGLWALFHVAEGGLMQRIMSIQGYATALGDSDYFYGKGVAVGPTGRIYLVGGPAIHVAEQ